MFVFFISAANSYVVAGTSVRDLWVTADQFELSILVISGALIAFALEVTEFLVLWHTSSLTLAVSGIVKVRIEILLIVI